MASKQTTATVFTCDKCATDHATIGTRPPGYHFTAVLVDKNGLTVGSGEGYACKKGCIAGAVTAVANRDDHDAEQAEGFESETDEDYTGLGPVDTD